jgi:diguanylate cyclase (GGDEF)-like protein
MTLTFVSAALTIALVVNILLICLMFLHCQSDKRFYFILSLVAVFMHILGYLLEITATSDGSALTAVKVMYIGNCFLPSLFLLFIIDYCRLSLRRRAFNLVRGALLVVPSVNLCLVWTSERHDLIFLSHFFDADMPLLGLQFYPGPLYPLSLVFGVICVAFICVILIRKIMGGGESHRIALVLMLISAVAAILADGIHALTALVINPGNYTLNFMPLVLIVSTVVFYFTVVRYGLFDFVPIAYSAVLDSIDHAFIILDPDMSCAAVNASGEALFPGITDCRDSVPVSKAKNWPAELADVYSLPLDADIHFTIAGDEARNYSASVDEIRDHHKLLGYTVIIKDITPLQRLIDQLEVAAYTDSLTGIYNRRHFMELAEKEFEKSRRLSTPCFVMIFDLDFFKRVNDTYGHAAGDEVLRSVTARVQRLVRSYDLFARYGGEEFVIMLGGAPDLDAAVAEAMAERIRGDIAHEPCVFDGVEIPVTLSIGVASGADARSLEDLLRNADAAMYAAKETGRNRVVVHRNS